MCFRRRVIGESMVVVGYVGMVDRDYQSARICTQDDEVLEVAFEGEAMGLELAQAMARSPIASLFTVLVEDRGKLVVTTVEQER